MFNKTKCNGIAICIYINVLITLWIGITQIYLVTKQDITPFNEITKLQEYQETKIAPITDAKTRSDVIPKFFSKNITKILDEWSEYLAAHNLIKGEGNSAQIPQQIMFYAQISEMILNIKNVINEDVILCEIGFNLGHSATVFLNSYDKLKYYGYDLGINDHDKVAKLMESIFGSKRFHVEIGDSTQILLEVNKHKSIMKNNFGRDTCDVLIVDGGHFEDIPLKDLTNFKAYIDTNNPTKHILIMDDLECNAQWCTNPVAQWNKLLNEKFIHQLGCWHREDNVRGFCWGFYV